MSQGEEDDQVKIKLLKSYFMTPSSFLSSQLKVGQRRYLTTTEEDDVDQYLTITQNVPKQLVSEEERESLQSISDFVADSLASGFVLSFLLSMFLNGLMSQLWNTFNTLQILLVMPQFSGLFMPTNVLFVQEIVD